MKKTIVILGLLIIAGCSTPAEKYDARSLDLAIENLSATTEGLRQLRREKDFFIKTLEDFERQQSESADFLDPNEILRQKQNFVNWQRDIDLRERQLEMQHAINVFAAHSQVLKRKFADSNSVSPAGHSSRKP